MTGQEGPQPHVEVWQQPDGTWRWRYVEQDGEDRVELPSNEPDSSRDGAVHKASVAYPGVAVELRDPPIGDPEEGHGESGPRRRRAGRLGFRFLVAAGAVVVAVRRPRWWTVAPAASAVAVVVRRLRER